MTNITFEEHIENHFPITVLKRQYPHTESLNSSLSEWVLQQESKYADTGENAAKNSRISTQGGYQTSKQTNLFNVNNPAIREFRDHYVMPAALHYLRSVFGDHAKRLNPFLVGWSNILREGDWQGPHMHPTETNLASGVYYVKVPPLKPPGGCIEFLNPHPVSVHHGFANSRRLTPQEGMLLCFPPFYRHYVHPFRGTGTRIIIAFDVLAQQQRMEFVF